MMWYALYRNGRNLPQFDHEGKEHLFKEIEEENLVEFVVRTNNEEVRLDMKTGIFRVNGVTYLDFGFNAEIHRLIYFRRVLKVLGVGEGSTTEHIGWQATIDGDNIKRILSIDGKKVRVRCD